MIEKQLADAAAGMWSCFDCGTAPRQARGVLSGLDTMIHAQEGAPAGKSSCAAGGNDGSPVFSLFLELRVMATLGICSRRRSPRQRCFACRVVGAGRHHQLRATLGSQIGAMAGSRRRFGLSFRRRARQSCSRCESHSGRRQQGPVLRRLVRILRTPTGGWIG